jgi:hypothetical protein
MAHVVTVPGIYHSAIGKGRFLFVLHSSLSH